MVGASAMQDTDKAGPESRLESVVSRSEIYLPVLRDRACLCRSLQVGDDYPFPLIVTFDVSPFVRDTPAMIYQATIRYSNVTM